MPLILDGTKGETFPSWTTATRPTSPVAGQTGYNTTLATLERYNGTTWGPVVTTADSATVTGTMLASATVAPSNLSTGAPVWDSSGNFAVGGSIDTNIRAYFQGASSTNANYAFLAKNSSGTAIIGGRNDGYVFAQGVYSTTSAAAANVFVDTDGSLKRSTSSLKYKENVKDATHGLSDVMSLRSVTYNGINDGDKIFGGLIAEEVDAAGLTEFVVYDSEGRPDALHYGNMAGLFVKAIQELSAKLDAAEARIAALEAN